MPIHPCFSWAAKLVATGFPLGRGGPARNDAADMDRFSNAMGALGACAPEGAGPEVHRPLLLQEFHRHGMKAFRAGWGQGFAHASLKMLISAIGAQQLLDHLENFKKGSLQPQEIAAADEFIAIIHQAHDSSGIVDTEKFLNGLQQLVPFNERNIVGDWKFKVESDIYTAEREPREFLPLISELFRLDTLPGWSFDIDETYVHQGVEQINHDIRNRFEMFQAVQTRRLPAPTHAGPSIFELQKVVDLLHADQQRPVKWGEGDAHFTNVTVRRQVCIEDVVQLKRLTISLPDNMAELVPAYLPDSVTLPAFDRKSGQKLLLTLSPREVMTLNVPSYAVHVRDEAGQWLIHTDCKVSPHRYEFDKNIGRLINFAVINAALAR